MQGLKTCIVVGICPSHWSIFAFYPSACRRKANKSLRLPFFATDCGQNSTNCKVLLHAFRRLWLLPGESRCLLLHFLLNGSSLREIIAYGADLEMLWPSCRHLTLSGLQSNLLRTNETIFPLCNGWGTIAHIGDWNVRFLLGWFDNDDDDDESFLLRRLHIDCIPIVYCHPLGDCNCHLPDTNIQYNSVNVTSRNNFIIKVNSQNTVKWHITYIVDTSRPYGRSICTGLNYALQHAGLRHLFDLIVECWQEGGGQFTAVALLDLGFAYIAYWIPSNWASLPYTSSWMALLTSIFTIVTISMICKLCFQHVMYGVVDMRRARNAENPVLNFFSSTTLSLITGQSS